MRLMIVGSLQGYITEAGKIALKKGAKVTHCESTNQALDALRSGKGADLVMVDIKQDIASFIDALKRERISPEVVACGVGNDTRAAVGAIKAGAKEYVPLPPNAELIAAVLAAVTEDQNHMIASAPAIREVIEMADQIAPSSASVLIAGESGTGKELMAHYIHRKSPRKDGPFIALNCAAIPENLLESELFGHEKGAFTGAVARRIGKFEEATNGTLFLDEISEMDINLQAKLLRAIQEKQIERIGSNKPVDVDIRLVATTNRDLEHEVKAGTFRQDLYFRLNVVGLDLPPLRERLDDIPELAKFFIKKFAEQNDVPERPLSEGALDKLVSHDWPGNIRELENTMHRAVLMARGSEILPEAILITGRENISSAARNAQKSHHLQSTGAKDTKTFRDDGEAGDAAGTSNLVGKSMAEVERDLILSTVDHCLGNRTKAAEILGISIRTLRNKLKAYEEHHKATG